MTLKTKSFLVALAMAPLLVNGAEVKVTVSNTERCQRQEVVEIDAQTVYAKLGVKTGTSLVVKNALEQEVDYQLTHDGKLLIDAAVRPQGNAVFTITTGKPQTMRTWVCGKQYPERVDDIAWENDRTAYRLYGPALQRSGERAFGIDVWVKNTPDLEVDKRYVTELSNHSRIVKLKEQGKDSEALAVEQATTYHYDHGYGLDCYKVGPTLGCGAPALLADNGQPILPYCYKDYEILDNGPLRFTVRLTYNPTSINGQEGVVEHRIISLDKGSNFCSMTVWYNGLRKTETLAAGVVLHPESLEDICLGRDFVAYADPTDNPTKQNFQIFVAALFPKGECNTTLIMNEKAENGYAGHAVGLHKLNPGEKYTYYFGSAWSKNDVRTFNEWKVRINEFLDGQNRPLSVVVE
ncbi:MAG: DUF4861 domain-containing protein [Prevotella sp.]|nr:DUF4861 domain-containing protein [Prevotella sp.]